MAPPSSLRQAPTPTQRSVAFASDPLSSGNRKMRLDRPRMIVGAEPQIGVRLTRVDELAGVHLVVGIPQALELAERSHQLGAEHLRQQRAARLAVAVLPRNRSAVLDDDVRRTIDELTELLNARLRLQVEVDAHVHASLAEVAVERAVVVVLAHQRVNRAQVRSEAGGRYRRVFPSFPAGPLARLNRDRAERRFPDVPHRGGFVRGAHDVLRPRIECRLATRRTVRPARRRPRSSTRQTPRAAPPCLRAAP